tara:strand:- start:7587 stop:8537 length:951 start_codon:yes stop_codon:yes gene_type:complete
MKQHINKFKTTKDRFNQFMNDSDNQKLRIRDIANKLNVSEAELLSIQIGDSIKILSINNFDIFFNELLSKIDKVMFLIRSDFVVHEKNVLTSELRYTNNQFINQKDSFPLLSFDVDKISFIFYEIKEHNNRKLRSFQFFDKTGNSVFKIYLKGKNKIEFDQIASNYKFDYNYEVQKQGVYKSQSSLELLSYKTDLLHFTDCVNSVKRILKFSLRDILKVSSQESIPIQIHAFGIGCVQYHRDSIKNVVDYGPWINIIDKSFNIHVLENKISNSCLLEHLSDNKKIYSLDFYDVNKNLVLGFSALKDFEKEFNKLFI